MFSVIYIIIFNIENYSIVVSNSKYIIVDARSCKANITTLKVDNTYAYMLKRILV